MREHEIFLCILAHNRWHSGAGTLLRCCEGLWPLKITNANENNTKVQTQELVQRAKVRVQISFIKTKDLWIDSIIVKTKIIGITITSLD